MHIRQAALDLILAAAAGYVGTKAMEPVSMKLYDMESAADREREDAVRPGPPYRIAAEKLSRHVGLDLSDEQLRNVGITKRQQSKASLRQFMPRDDR